MKEEIKFRNTTKIRTPLAKKDLDKAVVPIKERLFDTVMTLAIVTLHDQFGFGKKRCEEFMKRFKLKADCLMDDKVSWEDYMQVAKEELGIETNIRYL